LRDKGIAATRQLAKRQLTWLRHWDSALFYDPQQERMNQEITLMMKQRLDEL
jgi:tRNA dimethylallyltransferase